MAGSQIFTYLNAGKETTRGTPVAPTRMLYANGTGVLDIDPALNFHEAENSGVRTRIRRATQQAELVALQSTISGVSYDDLLIPFSQLKGAVAGVGGAADKTYTYTPSMTAANAPEAFSLDVGDDVQNWRCQYSMAKSFKLSAALGDVTSLDMNWFAQRAVKTAKATPAINSGIKIPGDLWTLKFATTAAGLTGASVQTNFLVDWDLEVQTGLVPSSYMDGNLYFGQHVETDISAIFSMTVESTALAVSELYDKWLAQTLDFVRLKATGPTLGGTNYSAQIDLPILWSKVEPITAERNGVNLYKATANLTYDPTSAASIAPVIVSSLTALP